MKSVRLKSYATVANLGCGFDVLGLCLHNPFDEYEVELLDTNEIIIEEKSNFNLPLHPAENVCGVALRALMNNFHDSKIGFKIQIHKNILPGSGLGSSSASSAGAVFGANVLLDNYFSKLQLTQFAMQGEALASGVAHADNVAPCIFGGITLVRSTAPLEVLEIHVPSDLYVVVIHPQIELKTKDARAVLKKKVYMHQAIQQWANVGALVAGLYKEDYEWIGKSIEDSIVEPQRKKLIPYYDELKVTAMRCNALGVSVSGSGPSVFFLCKGEQSSAQITSAITDFYRNTKIDFKVYVSKINTKGMEVNEVK